MAAIVPMVVMPVTVYRATYRLDDNSAGGSKPLRAFLSAFFCSRAFRSGKENMPAYGWQLKEAHADRNLVRPAKQPAKLRTAPVKLQKTQGPPPQSPAPSIRLADAWRREGPGCSRAHGCRSRWSGSRHRLAYRNNRFGWRCFLSCGLFGWRCFLSCGFFGCWFSLLYCCHFNLLW